MPVPQVGRMHHCSSFTAQPILSYFPISRVCWQKHCEPREAHTSWSNSQQRATASCSGWAGLPIVKPCTQFVLWRPAFRPIALRDHHYVKSVPPLKMRTAVRPIASEASSARPSAYREILATKLVWDRATTRTTACECTAPPPPARQLHASGFSVPAPTVMPLLHEVRSHSPSR